MTSAMTSIQHKPLQDVSFENIDRCESPSDLLQLHAKILKLFMEKMEKEEKQTTDEFSKMISGNFKMTSIGPNMWQVQSREGPVIQKTWEEQCREYRERPNGPVILLQKIRHVEERIKSLGAHLPPNAILANETLPTTERPAPSTETTCILL